MYNPTHRGYNSINTWRGPPCKLRKQKQTRKSSWEIQKIESKDTMSTGNKQIGKGEKTSRDAKLI